MAFSYKRTVVGFDIRKEASLNNLFMTSYDENIRYEYIYEDLNNFQNGLNLFFVDPSSLNTLDIPAEARIIAFDLPTDVVQCLLEGNVSNPRPLPITDLQNKWDFVGFDVVDPVTQTSAFHGFTLPIPIELLSEEDVISLNNYGLLEDFEIAKKIAKCCSDNIPEHAPFSPCGIWLKPIKTEASVEISP